jgi:alanine dehydrogenase
VIIGTPKETKDNERRVALTPNGAAALVQAGHTVHIETGAGAGSGFSDDEYRAAGAYIESDPGGVWAADLVMKVKEPLPAEFEFLHEGQLLFTYLHLAAEPRLTDELVARRVTAIAYETITGAQGELPILVPMSEVAGRMAPQVAAHLLTHMQGGLGKLLGGVPGVPPAHVVVLGAGTVGMESARIAVGMGARVTVFNRGLDRLRALDVAFNGRIVTAAANRAAIAEAVRTADVVVGAVLVAGARAPILVTEEMVRSMSPGAVIVDVAVDQGGCIETIHPTSHSNPTYVLHDVVHYAVPNMPGAVPRTSTIALSNATLPYALALAEHGLEGAIEIHPGLEAGINVHDGAITNRPVAEAHNRPFVPLDRFATIQTGGAPHVSLS